MTLEERYSAKNVWIVIREWVKKLNKVKLITNNTEMNFEDNINRFIKERKIISISYSYNRNSNYFIQNIYSALILYEEVE